LSLAEHFTLSLLLRPGSLRGLPVPQGSWSEGGGTSLNEGRGIVSFSGLAMTRRGGQDLIYA